MRSWTRTGPAIAILVWLGLALTASVACGGDHGSQDTQAESPGLSNERQEPAEKKSAPAEETQEPAEEVEQVTATLTYFESEKKGSIGAKRTMDVPFLPEGRKIATMETSKGTVKILLWEDKAPNTVVNFVHLANGGRYDGVEFHRVYPNFMAQTGDVEHKQGKGGCGWTIPAEFDPKIKHVRGVVSMARVGGQPDSAGSQFFIVYATQSRLDGEYAAFGEVIEGMEVIDSLKMGAAADNGMVRGDPDTIVKLRVESAPEE